MHLPLGPELEALHDSVDRQAAATIAPLATTVDRSQEFSPALWAAVRDVGLTRLPFAEADGGDGGNVRAYAVATREVARHAAVAALYPGTSIQVAMTLLAHGTAAQVARHVPALVSGDAIAAWAFTEPATGSDPRQITTRAHPEGDGWVLDGAKQFISFAGQAAVALVFARTSEPDAERPGWVRSSSTPRRRAGWSVRRARCCRWAGPRPGRWRSTVWPSRPERWSARPTVAST